MAESTDSVTWGWSEYFAQLETFLRDLERQFGIARLPYVEYASERLELCEVTLSRIAAGLVNTAARPDIASGENSNQVLHHFRDRIVELRRLIVSLRVQWQHYTTTVESGARQTSYRAGVDHSNRRGRPRFVISQEQLLYLRSLSFTWIEIATLLGVSQMTLYRRREEYGMVEDPRLVPSDAELAQLVRDIRQQLPYCGEVMFMGRLRSMGFFVTRSHLRQAIQEVDPISTALRWGGNI